MAQLKHSYLSILLNWRFLAVIISLVCSQANLPAAVSGTNTNTKIETWRGTKKVRFRITPKESVEQVATIMPSIDNSISLLSAKNLASVTKSVHSAFPKGSAPPAANDRPKTLAWISERLTKAIQEAHNDLGPHPACLYASAIVSKDRLSKPDLECSGRASIKIGEGLLVSQITLEEMPHVSVLSKDHKLSIATKEATIRGNVTIRIKVVTKFPDLIELSGETTFSQCIQDVQISKNGSKKEDLTFEKDPQGTS